MPLYEYKCRACGKEFTFLSGVVAGNADAACPRCASGVLQKLISRVSRGRSDDARMDAIADTLDERDLDDPRELRRVAREMSREMSAETGEDMSDEIEAMIEAESHGEDASGAGGAGSNSDDGTIY